MSEHQHTWREGRTVRSHKCSPSPCSRLDDHLWTEILQRQTCACGAVRVVMLGFENLRRRGDDLRRADGLQPIGRPLTPTSQLYVEPKVKAIREPAPVPVVQEGGEGR